ncbi:hypothetical protein DPMN_160544 [Dreissena polymorpha]|uniref:Uncharacterized protein n=1 Tax=Dreissena polymorpha TaxID=45954 RepID=A0A9D4ERA8_DREPO|nr:hypothetical protein DPMN_160544 [Dreissena polymorpha]
MSNKSEIQQESKRRSMREGANDIYLLYDEMDTSLVMPFAEHLSLFYKVFDPHTDGAQSR